MLSKLACEHNPEGPYNALRIVRINWPTTIAWQSGFVLRKSSIASIMRQLFARPIGFPDLSDTCITWNPTRLHG